MTQWQLPKIFYLIKSSALNAIFPQRCLGCGKPDHILCTTCVARVPQFEELFCARCHRRIPPANIKKCHTDSVLYGVMAAAPYSHTALAQLIHLFKYRGNQEAGSIAGTILLRGSESLLRRISEIERPSVIMVPVPLHQKKERRRGFNQSAILAKIAARHLNVPLLPAALIRIKNTPPQAHSPSRQERLKNLQDAFLVPAEQVNAVKNKIVILVDDVFTTGATLQESARALRRAGAKKIFGLVLAA